MFFQYRIMNIDLYSCIYENKYVQVYKEIKDVNI